MHRVSRSSPGPWLFSAVFSEALDGLWIDKLQEILDEANRAYGGKNDWQDQIRSQAPCDLVAMPAMPPMPMAEWWARWAIVDYFRSFLGARLGWSGSSLTLDPRMQGRPTWLTWPMAKCDVWLWEVDNNERMCLQYTCSKTTCSWLFWFFWGPTWYTLIACQSENEPRWSKKHCLLVYESTTAGFTGSSWYSSSCSLVDHDQNISKYIKIIQHLTMGGAKWIEDADSQQLHQLFPMWLREHRLGDGQAESGLENSELWERNWCTLGCLAGIQVFLGQSWGIGSACLLDLWADSDFQKPNHESVVR